MDDFMDDTNYVHSASDDTEALAPDEASEYGTDEYPADDAETVSDPSGDTQEASEQEADEYSDALGDPSVPASGSDAEPPVEEEFVFSPKRNPHDVIGGKKPGNASAKQNKTFITGALIGIGVVFVVCSTFLPSLFPPHKQTPPEDKQNAVTAGSTDYSLLVPKNRNPDPVPVSIEADEDLPPLPDTPEVVEKTEPPPPPPTRTVQTTYAGGSTAPARPDTRYDSLQSKTISGIKGLTPTQTRYADGTAQAVLPPPNAGMDNPYAQFGLPPKDQYLQQLLAMQGNQANAAAPVPAAQNPSDSYTAQNDQSGKMLFYRQGRDNSGSGQWLPQASIWQGTIFEATLSSDINTDLPGEVTALIAKNVYSSLDGKYILIPQNSRLFGSYNSSISYSQKRIQVGWHTLIRPDGYALALGNMQATDAKGAAGLPGIINDHPFQYLKALFLISAFRVIGTELSTSAAQTGTNQYVQNLYADTQNIINTFSAKIIDRALDVQPTITIKAGTKINIVVNNTLLLPPLDPYPVSGPYHR
jgi:type IV secretion system protein VirB10